MGSMSGPCKIQVASGPVNFHAALVGDAKFALPQLF